MATSWPQINPTGANGWGGAAPVAGPVYPTNPMQPPKGGAGPIAATGGPGNYNFGNAANPNPPGTGPASPFSGPTAGPTGLPGPVMNPSPTGALPVSVPSTGVEQDPSKTGSELGKIYGQGIAGLLQSLLQSGGGYSSGLTKQSVDAQTAAMQHQIQMGYGNLTTQMGQTGISPESSVAALESSNYFSNAIAQENAITAQEYYNMWNQSMNREFNLTENLLDPAQKYQANKPGAFGQISQWLGLGMNTAGAIGGAAEAAGSTAGWAAILAAL